MSKSRISRGGIAPPQGLMRPARSSSSTERPCARQVVRRGRAGRAAADDDDVEDPGMRSSCIACRQCGRAVRRRGRLGAAAPCATPAGRARASAAATRNSTASSREHRARRPCAGDRPAGAPCRWRPCRASRRAPNAIACAAPHRPMRTPSRPLRPCAGQRHHRADGRDGEGAVGHAEREDGGAQRPARADEAGQRPGRAARPPRRRSRRPSRCAASRSAGRRRRCRAAPTSTMPSSTPPCCTPESLRRLARREAEDACRRTARGSGPARCRPASRRRRRS